MKRTMRFARRRATIATSVIALLGAASACHKQGGDGDEDVQAVVPAQTVIVTPQAFTETMGAIGEVVPRAGHVATLSAPAAGRVGQVFVTTGQTVQPGQRLVELDQAPFRVSTQAADAALAAAERAAEREQRLANEGIAPRKDAEQAAADVAKARADAAEAHRAEELSVLTAPIAGVVTRMSATIGASVDPAQPLVEISDPRTVDVLLSVTPSEAARVQPGMKVTLSAGQSASGEPLGVGTVSDVSGTVDTATRSVAVRVQVPSARRQLRIGETVYGAIAVGLVPNAIVVPAEAVVPNEQQFQVFVVDDKGIAHARDVTIGGRANGLVEITSGLKAGERVVTYGAYGMQDSAKVAPLKAAPDSGAPKGDSSEKAKP
ncbi:MAG TPA: efflux RND transporter periplasmic adaptor subunit [Gemmatimonadaceae bacterium]|nr:efflux RND transporter periplasmic adaptor subunit [Gemmatimonadaceae bacterium]